jgi:hypothetical protein
VHFCVIDLTISSPALSSTIDHLELGTRFLLPAFEYGEFPLVAQIFLDPLPGTKPAPGATPTFSIDPSSASSSQSSSSAHTAKDEQQICMIQLGITDGVHQKLLHLFVPVSTFLSHFTVETTVDWNEWGVYGARILEIPRLPRSWVCFVYGSRLVFKLDTRGLAVENEGEVPLPLVEDIDDEEEEWEDMEEEIDYGGGIEVTPYEDTANTSHSSTPPVYACVLDFNRLSFQRFQAERFPASTIEKSTHESRWDVFRDRVRSSLQYCKTIIKLDADQKDVESIMLSEDNLILVPPGGFNQVSYFAHINPPAYK